MWIACTRQFSDPYQSHSWLFSYWASGQYFIAYRNTISTDVLCYGNPLHYVLLVTLCTVCNVVMLVNHTFPMYYSWYRHLLYRDLPLSLRRSGHLPRCHTQVHSHRCVVCTDKQQHKSIVPANFLALSPGFFNISVQHWKAENGPGDKVANFQL